MGLSDSFSQRARRAVFWANSRALQEAASEITAEHILYGVLQEDPGLFDLLVPGSPQLANQIEKSLVADGEVSKPHARTEILRLSDSAKEIVRTAASEKERFGHRVVGTQHLLLALLICPRNRKSLFRGAKPKGTPLAVQVLKKHGVDAERVEAATKIGIVTSQVTALDDAVLRLNAQLSALVDLLTAKGVFARHEFVELLDQNDGPITPDFFLSPLIDSLVRKEKLTEDEKTRLLSARPPDNSGSNTRD